MVISKTVGRIIMFITIIFCLACMIVSDILNSTDIKTMIPAFLFATLIIIIVSYLMESKLGQPVNVAELPDGEYTIIARTLVAHDTCYFFATNNKNDKTMDHNTDVICCQILAKMVNVKIIDPNKENKETMEIISDQGLRKVTFCLFSSLWQE